METWGNTLTFQHQCSTRTTRWQDQEVVSHWLWFSSKVSVESCRTFKAHHLPQFQLMFHCRSGQTGNFNGILSLRHSAAATTTDVSHLSPRFKNIAHISANTSFSDVFKRRYSKRVYCKLAGSWFTGTDPTWTSKYWWTSVVLLDGLFYWEYLSGSEYLQMFQSYRDLVGSVESVEGWTLIRYFIEMWPSLSISAGKFPAKLHPHVLRGIIYAKFTLFELPFGSLLLQKHFKTL